MKHKISLYFSCIMLLFCNLIMVNAYAGIDNKALPNKPNPPRLVNDFAGILSTNEVQTLEQKLVTFSDSSSNQIAIVTVANMGDYAAIEDFSYDLGKKWGVGKANKNNGMLLVISMAERKSRIEIGSGLEGAVPDLIASELIRNILRPAFKQQQYYAGLDATIDNLIAASKNEYTADPKDNNDGGGGVAILLLLLLFIFFIIYIKSRRGNSTYYMSRRGGRGWNDPWIGGGGFIGGGGSGGGFFDGGGGSGGNDFGGFGGGGFSGGGASGDW